MEPSDLAAAGWSGHRAPAVDACDRGRGRTAGADATARLRRRPCRPVSPGRARRRPTRAVRSASRRPLLADGRVLLAGGCGTAAEVYDPATGTFSADRLHDGITRRRRPPRCFPMAASCSPVGTTARPPARTGSGHRPSSTTRRPATFSPTGSMAAPRSQHTATLLADGRVLIAGGLQGRARRRPAEITLVSYRTAAVDAFLATAEIYDPTTGTFSRTGSMSTPHRGHTATLLRDGRVLVVGNGGESSASRDRRRCLRPGDRHIQPDRLDEVRPLAPHRDAAPDGRLLILGGRTAKDSVRASAELYDPATGRFTSAGSMEDGRQQHTATLLPDGRVFIAGGYWSDGQKWRVLSATEMYDPATGNFSPVGSMGTPREEPLRHPAERRPGPHRRRRGHREQWRGRGRLGGALPAVADQATTRRPLRRGGRRRSSGPARG